MNSENAVFVDSQNNGWRIDIVYGDIVRVKNHVKGADNMPLDLCYIAETGSFRQITDHIEIIVQCTYWLLYPKISEYSGKSGIESMEWFYNRINGDVLPKLMKAFLEAIINFTPFPVVKATMQTAGNLKTQNELIASIEVLAGQLQECMSTQESSESTQ